jgi:hypothetical protein
VNNAVQIAEKEHGIMRLRGVGMEAAEYDLAVFDQAIGSGIHIVNSSQLTEII